MYLSTPSWSSAGVSLSCMLGPLESITNYGHLRAPLRVRVTGLRRGIELSGRPECPSGQKAQPRLRRGTSAPTLAGSRHLSSLFSTFPGCRSCPNTQGDCSHTVCIVSARLHTVGVRQLCSTSAPSSESAFHVTTSLTELPDCSHQWLPSITQGLDHEAVCSPGTRGLGGTTFVVTVGLWGPHLVDRQAGMLGNTPSTQGGPEE